jgi:hypothetical protein
MLNDFYLNESNVIRRMLNEWKQYGYRFVIAYDYDDTVFDYHKKGYTYDRVIQLLRDCKEFGAHLVVFTACTEDKYSQITEYLKDNNIPFDAINESPSFIPIAIGKKIYYNVLLDDRAGLSSAFNCLLTALKVLKKERGLK